MCPPSRHLFNLSLISLTVSSDRPESSVTSISSGVRKLSNVFQGLFSNIMTMVTQRYEY